MAREFNVGTGIPDSNKWFLGENKFLDLMIFGQDDVTPLDMLGIPMEWSLKKKDSDPDPGIIEKSITQLGVSFGITIVGVYNADPQINTQRVRIQFASGETDPDITSGLAIPYILKAGTAYRHSLKRTDVGNEGVLTYGSCTFMQATEH